MSITWKLPGPDAPGHLRRRRELAALMAKVPTPDNVDDLARYLAQFVKSPKDPEKALDAVLDLPKAKYRSVISQIMGIGLAPVPDPKGASSVAPSETD